MLRDIKKIEYIIKIFNAVDSGANTIGRIHEEVGESKSYLAKIIALLRNADFIDKKYNFLVSLEDVTVADVVNSMNDYDYSDSVAGNINKIIIKSLDTPIMKF